MKFWAGLIYELDHKEYRHEKANGEGRGGGGGCDGSQVMELCSEEAIKYVWEGAIPLQIHLHESDVTTLPPPPPALVLGPRIGYLPLLVPIIKPYFSSALPPGEDTVWFDYKGLPLKWYVPLGVLFDLICAEPERPWNLTVGDGSVSFSLALKMLLLLYDLLIKLK